ncbi:MAG: GspE/PulE family protein, partial [Bdellovibrionales bacterium]
NIMTLEEPVEYQINLIRQTAIQEAQGLTFAEGVRGILRQDPDMVFIGEIRDGDTAQMALRAAMTGHKVFSTLHCNDALGALPRLVDLGLNPRMMTGNVNGILAQRLVRKLCPHCKRPRNATADEMGLVQRIGETRNASQLSEAQSPCLASVPKLFESAGCPQCLNGYKGRIAVSEILCITPALDELIAADAPRSTLRRQAQADGLRGMAQDGLAKVIAGEIDLPSLRRAVDLARFA